MSTIPSWKPTILPVVITAQPLSTWVLPLPTTSTFDITPGKIPPGPSTFTRGSTTSLTGVILMLSPGLASSTSAVAMCSSSKTKSIISCLLTKRVPFSILVSFPNWISLIRILPISRRINSPP